MNFKKLKRLLSIALSVSMVLSTNMAGIAAELTGAPEQVGAQALDAEEGQGAQAHEHQWQLVETLKGINHYACTVEGCNETTYEVMPLADEAIPAEKVVAIIGETPYDSFETAMEAFKTAPADTILTLKQNIHIEGTKSYNLEGKKILTEGHTIILDDGAILTVSGGTVINTANGLNEDGQLASTCIFYAMKGSTLNINGGRYETAGIAPIMACGSVNITGGEFIGTDAIPQFESMPMFLVEGGLLNMSGGTLKTAGVDGTTADPVNIYGIYLLTGGKAVLGNSEGGPVIESTHSVIGTNYHTNDPAISLEIYNGRYKTLMNATTAGKEQHNTLIYITGASNVLIDGGMFETTEDSNAHIISIPLTAPYNTQGYRNISITGGDFQADGSVFHTEGVADPANLSQDNIKLNITGGSYSENISDYLFGEYEVTDNNGSFSIGKSDKTAVAKVNGVGFENFEKALADATIKGTDGQHAKVELKANVTLDTSAVYDLSKVDIQTNGYTITVTNGAKVELQNATMDNNTVMSAADKTKKIYHRMIDTEKGSMLKINGGIYTSKASRLLTVRGDVTVEEASFTCNATAADIADPGRAYDTFQAVQVIGGTLKMISGAVTTDTILNETRDFGMHGISVQDDGTLILGTKGSETGPVVHSAFQAIGLNNLNPSATIRIYSGEYTSKAHCTKTNEIKFNSVIYLSATSDVQIEGGHFERVDVKEGDQNAHVVSIPYGNTGGVTAGVHLNITGGSFKTAAGNDVFNIVATADQDVVRGGTFSSDPSKYLPEGTVYDATENADGTWGVEAGTQCTHKDTLIFVEPESADCTKEGVAAHYQCSVCKKRFGTEYATPELTEAQVKIPREDHEGKLVPAKNTSDCQEAAHPDYYECVNCGQKFLSMQALKENKPAADQDIYGSNTTTPHQYQYTFDWPETKTFTFVSKWKAFDETLKEDGITVSEECQVCHEKKDKTITATVEWEDPSYSVSCDKENSITYVATFTPETEGGTGNTPAQPKTDKFTVTIPKGNHAWSEDITFAVKDGSCTFDEFKPNSAIEATRTCTVCDAEEKAAAAITTPTTLVQKCKPELNVNECTLTATFGEETPVTDNVTITTVPVKHRLSTYVAYQPADCSQPGNYAHYQCEWCRDKFWSPNHTEPLKESEITIPIIPHNFGVPKFRWETAEGTTGEALTAEAVFTCLKCHNSVVIPGLTATAREISNDTSKCNEMVNQIYDVDVTFNKSLISEEFTTDPLGYHIYKYNKNGTPAEGSLNETYKGTVSRQTIKGHNFSDIKVEWADAGISTGDKTYNEIEKGVIVTLTCQNKNCDAKVTIESKDNKTLVTGSDIQTATGKVESTLSEDPKDGYKKARCTQDGHEKYYFKVYCRTDDGKGERIYETKDGQQKTEQTAKDDLLWEETDVSATGHDWYVEDLTDVEDLPNSVVWDDPDYAQYPETAGAIRAKVVCANDPEHNTVLTGENAGVDVVGTMVTENATCTQNGSNTWDVQIEAPDGNPITKYGKGQSGKKITLSKTIPALGHEFEAVRFTNGTETSVGFDWKSYNEGKGLYYVYKCNRASCDGKADTPADSQFAAENTVTYEQEADTTNPNTFRTLKKVKATVKVETTKKPGCIGEGQGTTTATVKFKDTSKPALTAVQTGVLPAKGHLWSTDAVTWDKWDKESGIAKVTVKGKEYDLPVYSISGSRSCTRQATDDWAACDKPEDKDVQKGTLGVDADPAAKSYIKVTVEDHKDPTCTEDGYTDYKATFYRIGDDGTPVQVGQPATQRITADQLGHEWSPTVDIVRWEQKEENSQTIGNDTIIYPGGFKVDAYRSCTHEGCNSLEKVPVEVTVSGECGDEVPAGATGNVTFTATVASSYRTGLNSNVTVDPKVATYVENHPAHELKRIAASSVQDCVTPTYKRHYHCPLCGFNYNNSDAEAPIEISFAPQGHKYGEPKFEWTAEGRSARAVFTCTRTGCTEGTDGHTKSITASLGSLYVETPAKCKTWAANHQGENANGKGFYAVKVEFDPDNLPEGIDEPKYEDEIAITLEPGDHTWITVDGVEQCKDCQTPKNNSVTVIYKTHTDTATATIREDLYQKDTVSDTTAIATPTPPNQPSYQFAHWTVNGVEVTGNLADAVRTEIRKANITKVSVVAEYTKIVGKGKVTIEYDGITKQPVTVNDLAIGSRYGASVANETTVIEGNTTWHFSHWENRDGEQPVSLGSSPVYEVYIQSETPITIYAVYTEETPKAPEPTVAMTNRSCAELEPGGKVRLSFTATMSIPDNYEMVESGVLYTSAAESATLETMKIGTTGVSQKILNGVKTNTLSLNTSNREKVWYARGYVRCMNKDTKEEKVYYANNILDGSYTTLSELAPTTE